MSKPWFSFGLGKIRKRLHKQPLQHLRLKKKISVAETLLSSIPLGGFVSFLFAYFFFLSNLIHYPPSYKHYKIFSLPKFFVRHLKYTWKEMTNIFLLGAWLVSGAFFPLLIPSNADLLLLQLEFPLFKFQLASWVTSRRGSSLLAISFLSEFSFLNEFWNPCSLFLLLLLFRGSVGSDSFRSHGLQRTRASLSFL